MTKHKLFARALYAVMALALVALMLPATPVSAASNMTVSATPENASEAQTTTYTICFTTNSSGNVKYVDMDFAAGFNVSGATLGTVENITAGTLSNPSGNILRYTVDAVPPPEIAASAAITIILSSIVNPTTAGSYDVDVATKLSTGAEIDSGSTSVAITSVPASFNVTAPSSGDATAGTAFDVKITALNSTGAIVTSFNGTYRIHFTTTATGSPTIPAFEDLTFVSGEDTTSANFILTNADETPTITATAKIFDPDITGTSDAITVDPATAADHLAITGAPTSAVTAGVAFSTNVTVTAYDAYGNLATSDTESIAWTCDDGTATVGNGLPSAQTLTAGNYTFDKADFVLKKVLLDEAGSPIDTTITATGAGSGGAVTVTVTVNPAAASTLSSAADPASIAADGSDSSTITITAQDAFSNTDTNYSAAVTFETNFGTLSDESANFVSGVATANLTSTKVGGGTATVAVSSGTMTTTQVVTLTAAPTEVWVDDTGHDSNPGTEALPFKTIATGITAAGAGGTVNVAPGNYTPTSTLTIATDGVTLQSTGTAAETTINATNVNTAISITGDDVIVEGFTIEANNGPSISVHADGAIVRNNTIRNISLAPADEIVGTGSRISATNTTISGNTLNNATYYLEGKGNTVSGNSGNTINISTTSSDNVISGNTLTDIVSRGIVLNGETGTHNNTLIEGNILSSNTRYGIHVEAGVTGDPTVTNLVITGNTITDNGITGILIDANVTWGTGNTINNNNISGNVAFGINNTMSTIIDAENNWWGDASGPYNSNTNTAATGDVVSNNVDFTPWLTAEYGVTPVATFDLKAGYNFISLPKKVENSTFGALLSAWTPWTVYSYDPLGGGNWTDLDPSVSINDDILAGYWVYVETPGTISVVYKSEGAAVPPSKSLTGDAWNAIGFSRTTALDADTALMSIEGSWSTLIAWDAEGQAYEDSIIVGQTGDMSPGKGYWIWMTKGDVLSAISA